MKAEKYVVLRAGVSRVPLALEGRGIFTALNFSRPPEAPPTIEVHDLEHHELAPRTVTDHPKRTLRLDRS